MNVSSLIGCHLKSADIIDFLESWDAVVVYEFDRLYENTPDCYRVSVGEAGMELLFNSSQILETLFLCLVPTGDFQPFDIADSEIPAWSSIDQARDFAVSHKLPSTEGNTVFLGLARTWIKLHYTTYTAHYEFIEDRLHRITLAPASV